LVRGSDARYAFQRWEEDGSVQNPRVVEVDTPITLTAVYSKSFKVVLVSPTPSQEADSVEFWAPKDRNFVFAAKTDSMSRPAYRNVTGNRDAGGDTLILKVAKPLLVQPHFVSTRLKEQISALLSPWRPALGGQGGEMASRLVLAFSGKCRTYSSSEGILSDAETMRTAMMKSMGLRLDRRILSHEVQKRFQMPG